MDPLHYWRANLKLVGALLLVWFSASFLASIAFGDVLDQIRIGGFGLGFFMAQQGSIYIFVVLIFIYAFVMNKLDHKYHVDGDDTVESEKGEEEA